MATGFFWNERCFWHSGGNYSFMTPVGGLMQPATGAGLPENPETKRRLKNLMDVTGLLGTLSQGAAAPVTTGDLLRVHPQSYLDTFRETARGGGGELGLRTPFGSDGYDIATLSAGLAKAAVMDVLEGRLDKAYALSRPPGHHCLPDFPNGFCLLNNIAIAIEAAQAAGLTERVAVIDWDVHHGNGTEAIYYERDDVLTISLHQERNYPRDSGDFADRGAERGAGFNLNIPLPPGAGHATYIEAFERLVLPQVDAFAPDVIIVACGFDASGVDPLARMLAGSDTFRMLTEMTMEAAATHCDGKLILVHEGGYSESHVPFCGHAVIARLADSPIDAPDPLKARIDAQQPGPRFEAFCSTLIGEMEDALGA